jgi:protein SCO1/2
MKKVHLQRWLTSCFLVLIVFGCTSNKDEESRLPFYNQADFTPEWIISNDPAYSGIHKIADFNLEDQNGNYITNAILKDKIYVADFFFTLCPGICPKMTTNMTRIQEEFEEDDSIKLLSHSVMPWADSVSVLKAYADLKGIDNEKWHLLTGPQEEIYNLARQSYFAEKEIGLDKDSDKFLHTENFILIDGKGRIRGVYNGTLALEMTHLITDIRTLKDFG